MSQHRHGCNSRTGFSAGYYVLNRAYRPDGTIYVVQTYIKHAMSTACRYDLFKTDPHCEGCTSEKDIE